MTTTHCAARDSGGKMTMKRILSTQARTSDERAWGESDQHQRAKAEIAEALPRHPGVADVVVERRLDGVRPDVSCFIKGVW
jgi:hypothetical protein